MSMCVSISSYEDKTGAGLKEARWQGETSHCEAEDEEEPVSGACWHRHCN